jgi:hypothetical protein
LDTQTIVAGIAEIPPPAAQIADQAGENHSPARNRNANHAAASNGASNGAVSNGAAPNGAVSNGAVNGAAPNGAASGVNGAAPDEGNKDQAMALHGMTPTGLARRLGRCT